MNETPSGTAHGRAVLPALGVGLVTFLTRVPFLEPGYGTEPDNWRLIQAGRRIAATGAYHQSRSPGHPVPEVLATVLGQGAAWHATAMTALLTAIAAACLFLTLRRWGSRSAALPALAFALTPAVYVNSVNYMDYMWGLSFSVMALYLVVLRRPCWAGVLLALAAGSRIEYVTMLLPLGVLAMARERSWKDRLRVLVAMTAAAVALTAVLYVVPVLRYGTYTPYAVMENKYPRYHALRTLSVDLWGVLGCVGLLVAALALLGRLGLLRQRPALQGPQAGSALLASLVGAVFYLAVFFPHPHKVGYLVALAVFLPIVLAVTVGRRALAFACACIVVSPFVLAIHRSAPDAPVPSAHAIPFRLGSEPLVVEPFEGALVSDHRERAATMEYVERIADAVRALPAPAVVVVGHLHPEVELALEPDPPRGITIASTLRPQAVARYRASGTRIVCLPGAEVESRATTHFDLVPWITEPLRVGPRRRA